MSQSGQTAAPLQNERDPLREKHRQLRAILAGFDSAIIAFSGGVDSAYLAAEARAVLGDRALAVTADSPSYPARHRAIALQVVQQLGLRHEFVETREMERPEYRANPLNRCFYCKEELYTRLTAMAGERGFAVILDGNNADDRGDYRPGRAAARAFGVRSPLDEAGLTKDEIRVLAREASLSVWDEPASACLSSRIPYHDEVTNEKLRAIDRAEAVLQSFGFRLCRVRHHGEMARIELARADMPRALEPDVSAAIARELKAIGFKYVTLDLQGYRMGSLNEGLLMRPV